MRLLGRIAARSFVAVLIITGIAWCHTRQLPDEYRAAALLILDTVPFERQERSPGNLSEVPGTQAATAQFLRTTPPHPISMPDYTAILLCDEMMERLRPALCELRAAHGLGDSIPSRAQVRGALDTKPRVLLQTPYDLYYQHTLELRAVTSHPEVSSGLANAWAELGMDMINRLRRERFEERAAYLTEQLDRLKEQRDRLTASIEAMEGMDGLQGLRREISILSRPRWPVGSDATDAPTDAGGDKYAGVAAANQQITVLNQRIARLSAERDLLDAQIQRLYEQREEARLAIGSAGAVFKVVSPAYPPDHSSGPNRRITLLAALFIGLVLGPAHFFFMRALRYYAPLLDEH